MGITPEYELVSSWGLDHEKTFKIAAKVGGKTYGEGTGKSKQKAEMEAAAEALNKLTGTGQAL